MSRKVLRLTSVILSSIMIFVAVYTIFSYFNREINVSEGIETKGFAAESEGDGYNHNFDGKTDVTLKNPDYTKPEISLDDVVKELCNYGHVRTWSTRGAGYGDVWNAAEISNKTKDATYIDPTKITQLDCGEFIYAGLRHLNVRFTGFYDGWTESKDGRLGPIPVTPDGYVRYLDNSNPNRYPYHITWENGDEITRITKYTAREKYNEETDTMELDCGYGKWISDNNIAPGTIVVSPAGSVDKSGHVWIYIGEFNTRDDVVSYLKGLGIAVDGEDGNTTGIRVLDEAEGGDSKIHWSIECRGSSHTGAGGVAITNRDPASPSGNKVGAGYVGFTFLEERTGKFNINLVKSNRENEKLGGAEFKVDVTDGTENIYSNTITTSSNESDLGMAAFSDILIKKDGKTYKVTITETKAPDGYIAIDGPIELDVVTQKVGNEYKLVPAGDITSSVKNAKKVEVKENEILIEAENRTTSIDIHKGVKTVENQDSGYFYGGIEYRINDENQAEDNLNDETSEEETEENEDESTIVDETTGKEYTELELKDTYHEWVVETTIPEAADKYKKYLIIDPVDLTKLDFSGVESVVVQRVDKDGKVLETLTKDKDYQVEYSEDKENQKENLVVTYINEKDGNSFHGAFLTADGIAARQGIEETKVRVTFNTTFKVNEDGKLAVLDGAVTNAENKSTLTYDNGNGEEENKDSEQPEVHTGAVSIFKYEDTNGNGEHDEGEKALVGAEFKIALTEDDAKAGKYIKIDGNELTAVSNEHGIATFEGLSFGGDAKDDEENLKNGLYEYDWETASRDYYIVETKTPAGYEKLEETVKVTVSKNSSEIIDMTDKINEMESVGNRPLEFDLALRKWVTQAIVTEDGKTVVYETGHKAEDNPEDVVKIDLKKSKIKDVDVKFKYSIRITNEGEVAGEAEEITDYIPDGLKFVKEDNPDWETTEDERIVKTDKLKGVTLEQEESAEVEIILTWVKSESKMGVMINTAEISKDHNEFGIHDKDSTPNNKKKDEDDIDDAPVMLTIKTGSEIIPYVGIGLGFITVIASGVIMIKRSLLSLM